MGETEIIFSAGECAAWAPAERIGIVDWGERFIVIPEGNAEPGPLRFRRTPYFRGVAEAIQTPGVEEVVFLKPTQVGYSQFMRTVQAWRVDQDPGPELLIMPDEKSAREAVYERIQPLIKSSSRFASHLSPNPDDLTKEFIRFDSMELYVGWSGSPQSTATRPIRFLDADELDNWEVYNGVTTDALSSGRERTSTFRHRKKILIGSTPSTKAGAIWVEFESCTDQRCYFVPCPHCGEYQRLVWSGVRFGDDGTGTHKQRATRIKITQCAYYECQHCKGRILERHKEEIENRGVWISGHLVNGEWEPLQKIDKAGRVTGEAPPALKVGFWLNALYSLIGKTLSDVAAMYLTCIDDKKKMHGFKNNWMAEPFEETVVKVKTDDIKRLSFGAPPAGIVPSWARAIIVTADVQDDGNLCYYVVRAWGAKYKSQLIEFGTVPGIGSLGGLLEKSWPMAGVNDAMLATLLCVDARYKTSDVYEFAFTDTASIKAFMGVQKGSRPIVTSLGSKELGVECHKIDTNYYKDKIVSRRAKRIWLLNDNTTEEYHRHLAAEHKVRGKDGVFVWQTVSSGIANHLLDCETYQQAAADLLGVGEWEDEEEIPPTPPPPQERKIASIPVAPAPEPAPAPRRVSYFNS